MAHTCPECGNTCYCGGDIDDCLFEGSDEEMHCRHFLKRECDGYEEYALGLDFDEEAEAAESRLQMEREERR